MTPGQKAPHVCKMTCTGLQDVQLEAAQGGFCDLPEKAMSFIPQNISNGTLNCFCPKLCIMGHVLALVGQTPPGSSIGPGQEQLCSSPHVDLKDGPNLNTDLSQMWPTQCSQMVPESETQIQ